MADGSQDAAAVQTHLGMAQPPWVPVAPCHNTVCQCLHMAGQCVDIGAPGARWQLLTALAVQLQACDNLTHVHAEHWNHAESGGLAAATVYTSEKIRCQRSPVVIYPLLRALGSAPSTPQAALSEGEQTQGLQINFCQ